MPTYTWQKSSFSTEGANCLNLATAPDGTLRLRESDDPGRMLALRPEGLSALLVAVKQAPSP
ncbi:DUF397 domain-containing protein [Streptomyces dioscori]|uniref:DUF397 domain-containing protein n=1 Tax=Streptomyces dioscori TaxID=2109333 RepID=A0A2P8PUT0_9ACTN|nr:DUF397 domain-containing protein [Streptomyces dioscori]PSM37763.1 DUF397 domain-containing protein [Streptomyces dioscori]